MGANQNKRLLLYNKRSFIKLHSIETRNQSFVDMPPGLTHSIREVPCAVWLGGVAHCPAMGMRVDGPHFGTSSVTEPISVLDRFLWHYFFFYTFFN